MLFSKLTSKDEYRIKTFIDEFGPHRTDEAGEVIGCKVADLEYRLRFWNENKGTLYHLLNDNFILEKEVLFGKSIYELEDQIDKYLCDGSSAMNQFKDYLMNRSGFYISYSDDWYNLRKLFAADFLATNRIHDLSRFYTVNKVLPLPDGREIRLAEGSKPIKILGKIAAALGEEAMELFEKFRLEHSLALNNKKIKGTLCLSIHPMDYLTMSDNASGWSSCMSWEESGCYRRGTVEMMNSEMVVVGYLRSDSGRYRFGAEDWNDKRWRSLFIVREDGIVSIKGYPYAHEELSHACLDWLRDLAMENLGWKFHKEPPKEVRYQSHIVEYGTDYYLTPYTNAMYNDFGCTVHWAHFKDFGDDVPSHVRWEYDYSGPSVCMMCGRSDGWYYDEGFVYCDGCQSEYDDSDYCENCGCRIYRGEGYWVNDECYCEDCIDRVAVLDAIKGNYIYKEDAVEVYVARLKDKPELNGDTSAYFHHRSMDPARNALSLGWTGERFKGVYPKKTEDGIYYYNTDDLPSDTFAYYWYISDIEKYQSDS